jgi:cytosol alanyl aminopeptidase
VIRCGATPTLTYAAASASVMPVRVLAAISIAFFLSACPGEPPRAPKPPPPPAIAPPPGPTADGRLPLTATPTLYALDLTIDPNLATFTGSARIEVDIPKPTSHLVLHGRGLEIREAHGEQPDRAPNAARAQARPAAGGREPEEIVLTFSSPLDRGHAVVAITWSAAFDDELSGLYRVRENDAWYAFTQFEPADARRMFPCFDEPSYKTPYDVSVTVPKGMIAVANTLEAAREDVGDKTRFRFNRTPPLPTYLLALAAGELDVREATRSTAPPVRIVTTKGKAGGTEVTLALEAASGLVDALGEWFGIPYPYQKLDIVAVPDFRGGAMENAGLVTFREELLLLEPKGASVVDRRSQALVVAHELAHQWFGDFVTAAWWNDLWLNEGFATWMEMRIVEKWRPTLIGRVDSIISGQEVMDHDGLVSARAIRQPVVTTGDAESAFDAITYEKGAAVLSTIEQWIGEETFKRGVRDYLQQNAWKSVEAAKLFEALSKAAGKDVGAMAAPYVDTVGVPEVTGQLVCEPGSRWHMELSSQPWRPLGSKSTDQGDRAWTIPVCMRRENDKEPICTELLAGAPSLVAGRGPCPAYVHPYAREAYYRFALPEKEFVRLAEARSKLDVTARVTLLTNTWAAVRSGQMEAKALLKILPAFDDETDRRVVEQVTRILDEANATVVTDEARPAFRKFALARLAKRKKVLGIAPQAKGDASPEDVLARRAIVRALADVAEDDTTLREADVLATKWLADPTSVDADAAEVALDLAARRGGITYFAALKQAMKNAKTKSDRLTALHAFVGSDDEPRLLEALSTTLTDDVRPSEMGDVLAAVLGRRKSRPIAEAWIRARWDDLRKKLTGRLSLALVEGAGVGCSEEDAAARAAFYEPRVRPIEGAERRLAEALEAVSLCSALRERTAKSFTKALLGKK